MKKLAGKVAVITGGSQGIGFGISEELAKAGAKIFIIDIVEEAAQKAVASLTAAGYQAEYRVSDVSDLDKMNSIFQEIAKKEGHLDILMNNAGVNKRSPSFEVTEKDWDFIININLKASYFNAVNAARIMKEQGYGRIVNTCSINAFMTAPVRSVYAISKSGVLSYTKYLAREYAPYGITVNSVAPGLVVTPLNAKYFDEHLDEKEAALAAIPQGEPSSPNDIGAAVCFLVSDEAKHITGHTLVIDGGTLLGNGKA